MKGFRKMMAAALLAIPVLSLGASEVGGRLPGAQMDSSQPVTRCCYVYMGGYYICVPC